MQLCTRCTSIYFSLLNTTHSSPERWLHDVSRSCKLQCLPLGVGIFTHSNTVQSVQMSTWADRNKGTDQMERMADAPAPLAYVDIDVPQIPHGDHSSITLSGETVQSSGFLSKFFSSTFFFFNIQRFPNTLDKPQNTCFADIQTSTHMTSCHSHAGCSSRNYCNYLPSGAQSCPESRPRASGSNFLSEKYNQACLS